MAQTPTSLKMLPDSAPIAMPITAMPTDGCGMICDIHTASEDLQRLQVLGLCVGRRVRVVKNSNPMILSVMGTQLGINRKLAEDIHVVPSEREVCCQVEGEDPNANLGHASIATHSQQPAHQDNQPGGVG